MGSCLYVFSNDPVSKELSPPLQIEKSIQFPGIFETFEKLLQVDQEKMNLLNKKENNSFQLIELLQKKGAYQEIFLDPDFVNSLILHSPSSYLSLASQEKCLFYESLLTDLLKSSRKKNAELPVIALYAKNDEEKRVRGFLDKKKFLQLFLAQECPESLKNVEAFQIKNLAKTLSQLSFISPQNEAACFKLHQNWLQEKKLPYLCQIHEFLKDSSELDNEKTNLKIFLQSKFNFNQKNYLRSLCENLDDAEKFCDSFFNTSFWNKVKKNPNLFPQVAKLCPNSLCLDKLEQTPDSCLYNGDSFSGLKPWPQCDQLSLALLHSNQSRIFDDCPGHSDQLILTNISRLLFYFSPNEEEISKLPMNDPMSCLFTSSEKMFRFNDRFDNDENWQLEACYDDQVNEKEVCKKIYFSNNLSDDHSYSKVVSQILSQTRGADPTLKCSMISQKTYNPLLLEYKSGCFIIFEEHSCHLSECKHEIILNGRKITHINIKSGLPMSYFPHDLSRERYAQNSILSKDLKQAGLPLKSLSKVLTFFKKSPLGIIHGIGCAEDLLPSFFSTIALNQCSPLPFILSGVVRQEQSPTPAQNKSQEHIDSVTFSVRTAVDDMQAPRLINWSTLYSAVKKYQLHDPLKLWALVGLEKKK